MTLKSALRDLNNAVLDLQSSDFNTYARPLKRMSAVLSSGELQPLTEKLKSSVDFDGFLESASRGGSMLGSASLSWPPDREEELGLVIELIDRGAKDPQWFLNLTHHYYYSGRNSISADISKITAAVIIPFARDLSIFAEQNMPKSALVEFNDVHRVFIVHGRDEAPRESVARFISKIELEPVILHEQANRGMSIQEKLVAYGNVGFAVILITPDDMGRLASEDRDKPRARQNVILELGYFVGRLGRDRVLAMRKGEVDLPSDYIGVAYTPFDDGGGWRQELARELKAAGYDIDWNKVMQ